MDVFSLRDPITQDYSKYGSSFHPNRIKAAGCPLVQRRCTDIRDLLTDTPFRDRQERENTYKLSLDCLSIWRDRQIASDRPE